MQSSALDLKLPTLLPVVKCYFFTSKDNGGFSNSNRADELRLAKYDSCRRKGRHFRGQQDLPWWMFLDLRSRIEVENVAVY